jgi:hypothetical protein
MNDKLNQDGTMLMEIEVMRQCHHENIVNFIESYLVSSCLWVCALDPMSVANVLLSV